MAKEKRDDEQNDDDVRPPVSEPSDEDVQPVTEPEEKKPAIQFADDWRHPGMPFRNLPV